MPLHTLYTAEVQPGRLPQGTILKERYQVLSFLAQGSFARVYLTADQTWRGNLVALKEIPTGHFSEAEYAAFNAGFLGEAAFLMRLSHPGLPRVVEFFAAGDNYYLALEWIPGKTLEAEVGQRRAPVAEAEAVAWGLALAEVLAYLHEQKPYPVLLGDLKPANVVLDYEGRPRVVDFGLARYATPGNQREYAMVTPGFSPPEQYRKGQLDVRCDLYALGATLLWCLRPAHYESYNFKVPPLRKLRPDCSRELERFLERCLEPEAANRFGTARAVSEALSGVQRALGAGGAPQVSPADILSSLYKDKKKFQL